MLPEPPKAPPRLSPLSRFYGLLGSLSDPPPVLESPFPPKLSFPGSEVPPQLPGWLESWLLLLLRLFELLLVKLSENDAIMGVIGSKVIDKLNNGVVNNMNHCFEIKWTGDINNWRIYWKSGFYFKASDGAELVGKNKIWFVA